MLSATSYLKQCPGPVPTYFPEREIAEIFELILSKHAGILIDIDCLYL